MNEIEVREQLKCRIVILTGDVISRYDMGRFVVDLESLVLHKPQFSVDFNHNDEIPLGYCDHLRYEPGYGLIADGYLTSPNSNDKAYEVIQRLRDGFPFEISPTLDFENAEIIELAEGEKAIVNGIEVEGELTIYRKAALRGVGVVLFATDPNTTIIKMNSKNLCTLSFHGDICMTKKTKKELNDEALVKLADEDKVEEVVEEPKPEYLVLLEQMIEEFGLENAITYFRQGLDLDQARIADYEELKKRRNELMGGNGGGEEAETGTEGEGEGGGDEGGSTDEGGTGGGGGETTPDTTDGEGDKTDTEGNLKDEVTALKDELARLKAVFGNRGEDKPISNITNEDKPMKKLSAIEKMAEKIKRQGIKKA